MLSYRSLLTAALILCLASSSNVSAQLKIPFTFNLPTGATTSAGVYSKDGILLRTLWGGVKYGAGTQTASWDGMGDDGRLLANGNYDIRVLSNNVKYTWEGVIGNTSQASTGASLYRGYLRMYSMAFAGNNGYFANYYNEGHSSQNKFSSSSPQARTELFGYGQSTMYVATDGTTVYWAGDDVLGGHQKWFVFGTKVSDDAEYIFPNGQSTPIQYGRTYASGIDVVNDFNANITGMAVQKRGNYLFVARQNVNQIHVLNKTTGALVRIVTSVASPAGMSMDANDNIWIISAGGGINKYAVNLDGTLSNPIAAIYGVGKPWCIAASPDNSTVLVADDKSQQVKAFSNSNGAALWTYGQAGGYATDATVTDDKFYFSDQIHNNDGSFIAYQPDGSFWVEDAGNFRAQHYSAGRSFIERIMYIPAFYGGTADPNNPSRVFGDYLEFAVDYSKPLAPDNGSWKLVKNWGSFILPEYQDHLRQVTTLSNGHTYAFFGHNYRLSVVELMPTGGLRYTGVETENFKFSLQPDGSLLSWGDIPVGSPFGFATVPLKGFDGKNNPIWAWNTSSLGAITQPILATDPAYHGSGSIVKTSSNVFVSFDAGMPPYSSTLYHLGGVKAGGNQWSFRTAKATFKEYNGPFPSDGSYDIGNGVVYAGSMAVALDKTIIWGYHGEFWKGGQTNYFNHVYDDGLLISQFGTSGGGICPEGLGGNVLNLTLVKDGNGIGHLYHNDESVHAGIHSWKITGLESIQEQTVPVTLAPAPGGLLAQYYDGDDLNNFNAKVTKVNTQINNNPAPAEIQDANNYSSRWTGFISPNYSENYTFYASTNRSVRVWIDNNEIINTWNNTSQTESRGSIALEAGKKYAIALEMKGSTAGLSWSSNSQFKQVIPSTNLTPGDVPDPADGVDLLESLPFKSILENNLYGWQRDLKDEDTGGLWYTNWWSVKTSDQAFKKPDVFVKFVQADRNVLYTVTRDLGKQSGSWRLAGHIGHEGDAPGPIDNGYAGGTFNILDNTGKTIVNLAAYVNYNTGEESLYGNNKLIAKAQSEIFYEIWRNVQPLEISASNGMIKIAFGPYPAITVAPTDPTANWQSPKTMALWFRSNGSNGTRSADIVDMRFYNGATVPATTTKPVTPASLVSFKATGLTTYVNLEWTALNETTMSSYTVERSTDGTNFTSLGSVASKNATVSTNYAFADMSPVSGINYYRLKIIDNSGSVTYSDIVSVKWSTALDTNTGKCQSAAAQAYIANTQKGTQSFRGELGMEFVVKNAAGIVINQLGAFDDGGNGISGTQPGGTIRVAVFNRVTHIIVPGLDVSISGNADSYTNNHRMKNITPVTLPVGDYVIVAKGYGPGELNGNIYTGSGPLAAGDNGSGAIAFANHSSYGSDDTNGFGYPSTETDFGTSNVFLAGTFNFTTPVACAVTNPVTNPVPTNCESAPVLAYTSSVSKGNQAYKGELGMEFIVNNANGINIKQLGAFDDGGNGISGTQSGGVRVAVFNRATHTVVPGLDVIITGAADAYTNNHRMKNITPVTLPKGDYVIVAKGYNAGELNGNIFSGGGPFAKGSDGDGSITFGSQSSYGADDANGFSYPSTEGDFGTSNVFLAGTFSFTTGAPCGTSTGSCESAPAQAYTASNSAGTQPFKGELGMQFIVKSASGINIKQLGVFDDGGNGITGTQAGGSIRVAIFNRATHAIVPGLDVSISGTADAYTGFHRMKNITPVVLPQGDYVVVAKGYGPGEKNGNIFTGGTPFPSGNDGGGAISFGGQSSYGADDANGFNYPSTEGDFGTSNVFLAGTFDYTTNVSCASSARVAATASTNNTTAQMASPFSTQAQVVSAYPNPTNGRFNLQLTNVNASKLNISVMNADGKMVQQKAVNVLSKTSLLVVQFDLVSQPGGIYFVKVQSSDGIKTEKLIIQR